MLNNYTDTIRQYDSLIDEYNVNCDIIREEMDNLTQVRLQSEETLTQVQDFVNSLARTPSTIAGELQELEASVRKIPHSTSEFVKLKQKTIAATSTLATIAAIGGIFAASKKGRELIGKLMKSKSSLLVKIIKVLVLVILFLIPFLVSIIGTRSTQEKMKNLRQEDQRVRTLTETCKARAREICVLEYSLSAQLDKIRHLTGNDYSKLDKETKDSLGALVNSALALAKKINEELS